MNFLSLISLTPSSATTKRGPPASLPPPVPRRQKWLPVIDTDHCIGCERCVGVCDRGCLEMIWSFATLTRPHDCGSEGRCAEVCPQQIIHMAWVPVSDA